MLRLYVEQFNSEFAINDLTKKYVSNPKNNSMLEFMSELAKYDPVYKSVLTMSGPELDKYDLENMEKYSTKLKPLYETFDKLFNFCYSYENKKLIDMYLDAKSHENEHVIKCVLILMELYSDFNIHEKLKSATSATSLPGTDNAKHLLARFLHIKSVNSQSNCCIL